MIHQISGIFMTVNLKREREEKKKKKKKSSCLLFVIKYLSSAAFGTLLKIWQYFGTNFFPKSSLKLIERRFIFWEAKRLGQFPYQLFVFNLKITYTSTLILIFKFHLILYLSYYTFIDMILSNQKYLLWKNNILSSYEFVDI